MTIFGARRDLWASRRSRWALPGHAGLLALVLLVPSGASAQIRGTVLDQDGAPLSEVAVEAWGESRQLATRVTDEAGRFSFPEPVARRTRSLYARRLGYRAVRVDVEAPGEAYELRMEQEPLRIEGVVVEAPGDFCSRRPDDEAREIWESLRRRYSDAVDTLGIATYLAEAERDVALGELGPLELPVMGHEQRGSSLHLRFGWRRWIRRRGYARSILRDGPTGAFPSWVYPPLEADFAPHFVDPLFGDLHDFHVLGRTEGGWLLGFCPADPDRDGGRLRGRMSVARDTTLTWAEWRFETSEPDEDAGGRAVFPAVRPGERAFLLPTEGLFWRKEPGGSYHLTHQKYEGWLVSQGDSVPFLPVRRPGR